MPTILNLFAPGTSVLARAVFIGCIAITSAVVGAAGTATYYNNLILDKSNAALEQMDAAVQKAGTDAAAAQKAADRSMTVARLADQKARDAREKTDAVRLAEMNAFDMANMASTDTACIMPKATAHAINQVLQ